MAEFVQLRKEKWIDTVNWLKKLEILKVDECRLVIEKIDSHEYKIQAPNRKLEYVLAYIQFLCNLLKLIQRKRKLLGQNDKTDEIDRFIYNDICSQFGSAEINFSHSKDFWNARLKFVATVILEQDRENEFNTVFKKALNYCGRTDLEFYQSCVEIQWSFLKIPATYYPSASKAKKKRLQRRDCSKLMSGIREITREAMRNLSRSAEATTWVLTTELKYLNILIEEKESTDHLAFDINEEVDKTEKLIKVLYQALKDKHENPVVFTQLFDAVSVFGTPQAKQLSKEVLRKILLSNPRSLTVSSWLITKSIDENKIDECLERMSQALSSTTNSKLGSLHMCVEKLDSFLNKLKQSSVYKASLPKLIQFSMKLFDVDTPEWEAITSEIYLTSRVQFIKSVVQLIESANDDLDDDLKEAMKAYLVRHELEKVTRKSIAKCPTSFYLARERILQIVSSANEESIKPAVILKHLSNVNWKKADVKEAQKFLNFVYYAFLSIEKLQKKNNITKLLSLQNTPALEDLRILHLRKLYLEDLKIARRFYMDCSKNSSDWRFSSTAIEIETNFCRNTGKLSSVLQLAIENMQRLAGTSSTEPWKVGVSSLYTLNQQKEASELMQRALKEFSSEEDLYAKLKDLHRFAAKYKNSAM